MEGAELLWRDKQLDAPHAALPSYFTNVVETPCQGSGFWFGLRSLRIVADPVKQIYRGEFSGGGAESPTRERISSGVNCSTSWKPSQASPCKTSGTERLRKFYDKARKLLEAAALAKPSTSPRKREITRAVWSLRV
jgi:hypothetical protein